MLPVAGIRRDRWDSSWIPPYLIIVASAQTVDGHLISQRQAIGPGSHLLQRGETIAHLYMCASLDQEVSRLPVARI